MRITSAARRERGALVARYVGERQPEHDPPDGGSGEAVEPTQHGRGEAEDEDRIELVRSDEDRWRDQHAGEGAHQRRQGPPQREHPPDAHAQHARDLRPQRRGAHLQADPRPPEQPGERDRDTDDHEHGEGVVRREQHTRAADVVALDREGRGKGARGVAPDHAGDRLQQDEQAERDDHRVQRRTPLDPAYQHALDDCAEHEPAHQRDREAQPVGAARVDHARSDERGDHEHRALGEVDDPRRPPDEHQRERDDRVHGSGGDPVQREVDESRHPQKPR